MNELDPTNISNHKRRRLVRGGLLAIIASITIVGTLTYAAPGHFNHFAAMHGDFGSESASRHIEKTVSWVLDDVDATKEQKAKVKDIFNHALTDLQPIHKEAESAHQQIAQLLSQDVIDRVTLEQIRASHIALLDTASKRLTLAIEDAADVLTPAQRQKLLELHHRHNPSDK